MSTHPVLIIGAGISGLSVAYALQKQQVPYLLLEAADQAGGVIRSFYENGFELDAGPNSLVASESILLFFKELGLEHEILQASAKSKHRFLVRNNQLHRISPHPFKILGSSYLSRRSKWRLFTERFRKASPVNGEETVTDFVTRRFDKEIADYLFDPVLSGIYAGNPDLMSVAEVLPVLPRWEREYGSVTKGLMKNKETMSSRKIISLKGGNQVLTRRMQQLLTTPVRFNCVVEDMEVTPGGYRVNCLENGMQTTLLANKIIFTTPAYCTAKIITSLNAGTADLLNKVHYPKMGVLHLGFESSALPQPLEGFGFLIPHAENKHFLGVICNAAIFPGKAPAKKILLTVFVGGARQEYLFDQLGIPALQQKIVAEIQSLLRITAAPVMQRFTMWQKAIPQLNVGHAKLRTEVEHFEKKYPGLFVGGNYLHGIAISTIIEHAFLFAASLKKN